jgi:hypothetical protein
MRPDSPMRAPILQGTSTGLRVQEPPRGRLLARAVDFGGREEVEPQETWSRQGWSLWMKEGKIKLVRRRVVILSLGWSKPYRHAANKTLLTTEILEFLASVTHQYSPKLRY